MKQMILTLAALLAGCNAQPEPTASPAEAQVAEPSTAASGFSERSPVLEAERLRQRLVAELLILAEWSKAENKSVCAPVSVVSDGGKRGTPRRANFGGGWAVAFDLPRQRSAYGLAGAGLIAADRDAEIAKRERLIDQWPSFRDLPALPQPAYAGYGVEGGTQWADDDPQALRSNALAYVRIGGQTCQYNVWSRLGRVHLEKLLENLRVVGRADLWKES